MPPRPPEPVGPFADGVAHVDGQFVPVAEARIPLLDRGFTRSDATYDVTHVWRGYIFRLDDYLDRFERNVAALRMELPLPRDEVRQVLFECVRRSGLRDAYVQMTCTRGIPPGGTRDPRACTNRFYAFAIPFVWIADPNQQQTGLNLHVSSRRRIPADSIDPRIKNFHWLDMTMGLFEAFDASCGIDLIWIEQRRALDIRAIHIKSVKAHRHIQQPHQHPDKQERRPFLQVPTGAA